MADFVANTTTGLDTISTGVLRKFAAREMVYTGASWIINADAAERIGRNGAQNAVASHGVKYTFFGTGFEARGAANTDSPASVQLTLTTQGISSTDFSAYSSTTVGTGITFTDATGVMVQAPPSLQLGAGVGVSGIPLGTHTIDVFRAGTSIYRFEVLDVITPSYSYKNSLLNTSDALVGSNSLKTELLVPGATRHKIIATAGIDTAGGVILASGTYTPILPNSSNMDALGTPTLFQWSRVGNMVTVIGAIAGHNPKADSSCEISLPLEALPSKNFNGGATINQASGFAGDTQGNAVHPYGTIRHQNGFKSVNIAWRTTFDPTPFNATIHFSYIIDF